MVLPIERQIEYAQSTLQIKLDWISRHDNRVSFVTGVFIAMLGVLAKAASEVECWNFYLGSTFSIALLLIGVGICFVYLSHFPKTNPPNTSLIFFGSIAGLNYDDFQKKFKNLTQEDYLADILYQIHINSKILSSKFYYLKGALIFLGLSILPWSFAIANLM